jgi:hypothetical protein
MDEAQIALAHREHRLEVWKVLLSILTPLVLVELIFVVNNAIQERGAFLKREEQILAEKQKIYSELGLRLNTIYVYIADIGDFRSYTPPKVVQLKREADRQFNMCRPYWSDNTKKLYEEYMDAAFLTHNGPGFPAKINSSEKQKIAAYSFDKLKWDDAWNQYFTGESDPPIGTKYSDLVESLLEDTVDANIYKQHPKSIIPSE